MIRLTEWFPADVKPVRVGVYEVNDNNAYEFPMYAYWDGVRFGYRTVDSFGEGAVERAFRFRNAKTTLPALVPWRGLAEQPK